MGGQMEFNLNIEPEAGGTVTPLPGKYDFGSVLNLQATPNEGYDFERWSINGETLSTDPSYNFTLISSNTLTASFKLKLYKLTVEYNDKGGVVAGGGTGIYTHGSRLVLRAEPFAGYVFSGWKVDGIFKDDFNLLEIQVISDLTVEAIFTKANCNITVDLGGNRNVQGYDSVVLDAGSGFSSYLWSTGETTRTVTITNPNGEETITVWVEVTAMDGCVARDEITIAYSPTGNIYPDNKDGFLKVFPNPLTNDMLNVWFAYPESREISMYDLLGKLVYRKKHAEEKVVLELPRLKAGIYFLKINNQRVEKIISR